MSVIEDPPFFYSNQKEELPWLHILCLEGIR